jgi:hypothetical protein
MAQLDQYFNLIDSTENRAFLNLTNINNNNNISHASSESNLNNNNTTSKNIVSNNGPKVRFRKIETSPALTTPIKHSQLVDLYEVWRTVPKPTYAEDV